MIEPMNTILITGSSSGFGLATARHFLDRGWNVVATMRTPSSAGLEPSGRLRVLPLDVTDPQSIAQAVQSAGSIDALVNNAGIGALGALEGTSMQTVRALFEANTLGTIAMTQAVLPQMRQRGGVIVNVTSAVTLAPHALLAAYSASKAAVNAFTESLALELQPFGVRMRLVLPGRAPDTRFGENARPRMEGAIPQAYAAIAQKVFGGWGESPAVTQTEDVVQAVWRAVTDEACPMRLPAGADAVALSAS